MVIDYPGLEKLERKAYAPFGRCIYCDSTEELTDEHIIPFGLGGTLVLPESSCRDCADKTSKIERKVLRGELWPVRIHRALRSRRKHRHAPKKYPLTIIRKDQEEVVEVPLEEFPILVPFLEFAPARLAIGQESKDGIDVKGIVTVSFGPSPEEVLRRLGGTAIKPYVRTHPVPFARLVAKIGYAMAAATRALEVIEHPSPIRPIILGENANIGDYVGTLDYPLRAHADQIHRVVVSADHKLGQLVADVHIFSDSSAPRYGILLGKLK